MKPIDQRADLMRYYEDRDVVGTYMQRRTGQPLNGVLHRRQVRFVNHALAVWQPRAVLEIACGPGRLTAEVRGVQLGVAADASPAMLETAKQRLNGGPSRWWFLRTDAFALPFRAEAFDAVYTLRFLRHFQLADRQRLYAEIRRVLHPGGLFMLDALNRDVSLPYRLRHGVEKYHIYDALYHRGEIGAELQAAGFRVVAVQSVIKHPGLQRWLNCLRRIRLARIASVLIGSLEYIPGSNPTGWMLLCERQC
jgi:ubiquinone/menaquinone biosynthesis C-methylase UbiE